MASGKKAKSLTALAKSLDTRKRAPPLPAKGEGVSANLIREKLAVLPPKVALPPKPPPPAPVFARAAPAPASVSRAGALASMQRTPSHPPARMPTAINPKANTTPVDARRQYPRAELQARAHLSLADDPSRYFEAALPTVNLSVGGMFLESSFFLKIGTKLLVTLQLPQKGREVKVKAEVVRVESNVQARRASRCASPNTSTAAR